MPPGYIQNKINKDEYYKAHNHRSNNKQLRDPEVKTPQNWRLDIETLLKQNPTSS